MRLKKLEREVRTKMICPKCVTQMQCDGVSTNYTDWFCPNCGISESVEKEQDKQEWEFKVPENEKVKVTQTIYWEDGATETKEWVEERDVEVGEDARAVGGQTLIVVGGGDVEQFGDFVVVERGVQLEVFADFGELGAAGEIVGLKRERLLDGLIVAAGVVAARIGAAGRAGRAGDVHVEAAGCVGAEHGGVVGTRFAGRAPAREPKCRNCDSENEYGRSCATHESLPYAERCSTTERLRIIRLKRRAR